MEKKKVSENRFVSSTKIMFFKKLSRLLNNTQFRLLKDIFHTALGFLKQGFDRLAEQ